MSVYVFTGPTLSPQEARGELDAMYLPPVSQGDVYRVTLKRPVAIGIIDGYFEHVPAVWHKEILWAMKEGIHVFGSASMGALRAAELASFGMVGVGAIFEAYASGELEDDDEIAVAHGAEDTHYHTSSEAMVNIRRTLSDAVAAGIIGPGTCKRLEHIAKALYYPGRSYPVILERGVEEGLPAEEISKLRVWLPRGRVNQKREDALTMVRVMREFLASNPEPKAILYSFQHTDVWDHAWRLAGQLHIDSAHGADTVDLETLLDELRLNGTCYRRTRQAAIARFLALEEARRQGMVVTPETLGETVRTFCAERGLASDEELQRWLQESQLTHDEFAALMEEEAQVRWVETMGGREMLACLPSHLRVAGDYGRLVARARDKQRALESWDLENPALADVGLTDEALQRWYFEEALGREVPWDVVSYVRSVGFPDEDAFRRAILREYCYVTRDHNRRD